MKKAALLLAGLLLICTGCAAAQSAKYEIAVVTAGESDENTPLIEEAAEAYYQAHSDVNVYTAGYEDTDGFLQMQTVEDLIAQQVDGICIVPIDEALLAPMVEQARSQGIAVAFWEDGETPAQATDAMIETALNMTKG